MEPLPVKLEDYCKHYGISFFDLRLRCIFCNHYIDCIQLASFHHKQLALVWRGNVCFAACTSCIRLTASYERERFYQCNIRSDMLVDFLHKPLDEIVIRCLHCLCKLDLIEKLEHCYKKQYFHLVRCYWRGECRNCKYNEG
uniref:Protein E6 n=1 Tax=Human papillomavirus TaxID=10566 RepID=A0A385PKC4_9PAPI|nr:MAG: E6 protein [Human papillomavirus]